MYVALSYIPIDLTYTTMGLTNHIIYSVPNIQRLVYSTCSIHATENENVVLRALQSSEAKAGNFRLASRDDVIPSWHRRGLATATDTVPELG